MIDKAVQSSEWKTLRLLEIDGRYFAFQQLYHLHSAQQRELSGGGVGGVAMEKMPKDEHRLKPMSELVDMEGLMEEVDVDTDAKEKAKESMLDGGERVSKGRKRKR